MKCLLLSTFEQQGGAARSAHRLYQSLQQMGIESRMLVQYKDSDDSRVLGPKGALSLLSPGVRPYLDAFPLLFYRTRLSPPWSLAWLPKNISQDVASFSPGLIHLHSVGHGFLSLAAIRSLSGPLVWTLHDSWPFTGGCHLPGACELYQMNCGCCPQLNARHEHDLSRWGWNRKAKYWPELDITFVAPSRWMAQCARSSSLLNSFPIEVIPNGIDTSRFVPGDRDIARAAFGLPQKGLVLLYGASAFTRDNNKGFAFLKNSLSLVAESLRKKNLTVAVFGDGDYNEIEIEGIPVRSYGGLAADEKLISLYRAADVFVLPSLQESLSNTVMEAMACGTPCVAFDVGGVGDLISHGGNGFFAKAADEQELAEGIMWMLADEDRRAKLGRNARETIEDGFSLTKIAALHVALYNRILDNSRKITCRVIE
jgi:glycosyltransferase involved in cell wall biosynthesis